MRLHLLYSQNIARVKEDDNIFKDKCKSLNDLKYNSITHGTPSTKTDIFVTVFIIVSVIPTGSYCRLP